MKTNQRPAWVSLCVAIFLIGMLPACRAQNRPALPAAIQQELARSMSVPQAGYQPAGAWSAGTDPALGHGTGHKVQDKDTASGFAWEALPGKDKPGEYAIYGPYADVPAGDYAAFFRLKVTEDTGGESPATLDTCVSYGETALAMRDLNGPVLVPGKYVEVPLLFHTPGGKLECRVRWTGYFGIRIDTISLFHLVGTTIDQATLRAPEATLSGKPNNLDIPTGAWPYPEIFPRSAPPASKLYVLDLTHEAPDWQLMALCIQGIVNRSKPEIYCLFNSTDQQWLDYMRKRGWIQGTQTVKSPRDLLLRYRDRIKGAIITDPALPATVNIATMLAGVDDAVAISPRLAKQVNLPVIEDLRGRWKTSVEAYQWALDNLWPQLNHHLAACSYPQHLGLRDYLVENKAFIFWISGALDGALPYNNPTLEAHFAEQLLAKMPPNTPIMSYPWAGKDVGIGEGPGVTLFAEFGKYLVGSIDCSNLSVHSGIRIADLKQKPAPPTPKLDETKVYVTPIMSDGDNLPVLTIHNFPQLWTSPVRGKIPIGWSASPSASMLIPDIVDYYYSTASPDDEFICAVSGIGYTYPDSYGKRYKDRSKVFDGFLDQTATYMKKMDEDIIWPMNITSDQLLGRYAEKIPFLKSIFPDYGKRVSSYGDATYLGPHGIPIFHAVTGWQEHATREEQITGLAQQIRAITPVQRPAFLHFFLWNWGSDLPLVQAVMQRLGPDYVAVRPDQLTALYHAEMARHPIQIRTPSYLAAVQGDATRFNVTVVNAGGQPADIAVSVTGGLDHPTLTPSTAHLPAGEQAEVSITGATTGDPVVVEAQGGGQTVQAVLPVRIIPANQMADPLPDPDKLVFAGHFEAAQLSHRSGTQVEDPDASGKSAWAVIPGQTDPGDVMYGPYAPMPAGDYVAVFCLKRTGPGQGPAITLDASANGGKTVMIQRQLSIQDLPEGQYRCFVLSFHHPGGPLETRANWPGGVPIRLDCVDLWRKQG